MNNTESNIHTCTKATRRNGILISCMGKGKYKNLNATRNVIRYILRGEGCSKENKNDVIYHSAYGATDLDINIAIHQFEQISAFNTRKTKKKRYIDHQIFSFNHNSEKRIKRHPELIPEICSTMAEILSDRKYQVVYALQKPDTENNYYHIHFAVNTVSFIDARKRQENYINTQRHQQELDDYLEKSLYPHPF